MVRLARVRGSVGLLLLRESLVVARFVAEGFSLLSVGLLDKRERHFGSQKSDGGGMVGFLCVYYLFEWKPDKRFFLWVSKYANDAM